ncbi:DUF302 domain-containing protein [Aquibium sp. LZ166]|uniref:DUF302 domain-containing protein n=1 Tax=Aquibium pacificus TaxID=3153579 RepID=A0ABV3SSG0_9HYPH
MKRVLTGLVAALSLLCGAAFAAGDDVVTVETTNAYDDVAAAIENAIVNRGYVIDYRGHVGEMLQRTATDVGATKDLYSDAEFFAFCSAVLSRKVMEAEIGDIAYCPYVVFVYEAAAAPGKVTVGFRKLPPGGPRDEVNDLLTGIVEEAAEGF